MARHRYLAGGLAGALLGLVAMLVGAAQDRTALAVAPRAQAGAEPNQATAAVAAGAAKAKPQPVQESTRVQTTVGAQGGPAERTWDIRPYLAMEDTQQAAAELRAYAQGRGLSLEARKPPRALPAGKIDSLPQEGIVVFNGTTLPAQTGVEESLAARADQLAAESRGQETIVAILQVREDLRLKDVIELLELGVKFHEPLGHAAAIVRLPAAAVPILAGKAYIRWIGEYKPIYKYRPEGTNSGKGGALVQSLGGDRPAYRADLARLGIPVRGYDATSGSYDVLLEEGRFGEVAAELWWVRGLTKEPEETPAALGYEPDDSRQLILAFETAYNGTGVPIGVRDTGVNASHPDLVGHLLAGSDALTNSRHGTVVCSILMGRGTRNLGCTYNAKGVAFGSDVLFKNTANSYASAFAAWQAAGIQISNHSYSFTGDAYAYDANTAAFDGYADSDDAVILAACGDSGTAVTNPATGKNVLAVGAITYADSGLEQIGARASYSNPGPTRDDHRLKPELVAPGGGSGGNTYGVVGANDTPDGVATGDEWPADDQYVRMSGTSMAAPHVAGVCAKIKQWKQDIHWELLKALLINTTIPIKANSTNPLSGYANTAVGYGMVNGYSVTEAYAGESQRVLFVEDIVSEDARTDQWPITVPAGTRQLVVTLAYNDLAGALSIDRAVKDDLDLSLTSPGGVTTHAYVYKAAGVTRESPLEKMVMAQPAAGTWTVRVEFSNSPRFSDPLLYAEQRYALVGHVILKAPALEVTTTQALYEVAPRDTVRSHADGHEHRRVHRRGSEPEGPRAGQLRRRDEHDAVRGLPAAPGRGGIGGICPDGP